VTNDAALTLLRGAPIGASVVAIAAALTCVWAARQYRSAALFWTALSIWTGSMAVNTLVIHLLSPTEGWLGRVPDVALASSALSVTIATWVGARPLLTHRSTRTRALIALPAGLLLILGVLVGDAAFSTDIDEGLRIAGITMIVLSAPIFFACAWLIGRELQRCGRQAEILLLAGSIGHAVAHITALNTQRPEGIWLAIVLSSGGILVASLHPTSASVGSPLEAHGHVIHVRLWPAGLAGVAALAVWVSAKLLHGQIHDAAVAVAVVLALVTAVLAGRELAGPRKPLLLPFSKKDRTLHGLPGQLVCGNVRLVGRPVHRVGDGSIAGIEAEASWKSTKPHPLPLAEAATAVGLSPWLQHVTLAAAKAHLPAINAALNGDDPFLSVPFNPDLLLEPDDGEAVEGLVLRTPANSENDESLVSWQDRGAMVHSTNNATNRGVILDIVTVDVDGPLPRSSMTLARSDLANAKNSGVMFVVNDEEAPVPLGTILSPVISEDSEVVSVRDAER